MLDRSKRTISASARPSTPRRALPIAGLVLALAGAHIIYLRFLCDDAFISFRYAANLAHGHGLTYNPGERVEGYSNFLWTLFASVVVRLGGRPELVMPVVSALLAILTVAIVMAWVHRRQGNPAYAGLLLAANTGFAAWGTSGLETALFTFLVTAGCLAVASGLDARSTRPPRLLLGAWLLSLASLTRPDGLLVSACAGAFMLLQAVRRRLPWASWWSWAALWTACVAPHLVWRHAYYGRWLPNSYAIKGPALGSFVDGAAYLAGAFVHVHLALLALPIAIGIVLRTCRGLAPREAILLAWVVVPFLLYVCSTGGDWMPLYRFTVPMLPLVAVASGATLEAIAARLGQRAGRTAAAACALALFIPYVALNAAGSLHEQEVWDRGEVTSVGASRLNVENMERIGGLLAQVCLPTDTLATSAAGIVPYRSGLYNVDLLGLNAPDLSQFRRRATHRPGHRFLLAADRLHALRPQILLADPVVRPTPAHIGLSLDLEPPWRDRILADYTLVALALAGTPTRYVGCMLRNDILSRVQEASARLEQTRP